MGYYGEASQSIAPGAGRARGENIDERESIQKAMLEIAELVSDAGGVLTMDALVKGFLEWQSRKAQSQSQAQAQAAPQPNLDTEKDDRATVPQRGALSPRKLRRFDDNEEDLFEDETDQDAEDAAPAITLPIPDRASFEDVLEDNFKKARRDLDPMCVAVCSVNRIPQIIAKHGRATAQRLLERIAALLNKSTGGNCHSARKDYEFVIVSRGKTPSALVESLQQGIDELATVRFHDKFSREFIGMCEVRVSVADVFDFPNPSVAMRAADVLHRQMQLEGITDVMLATKDMAD